MSDPTGPHETMNYMARFGCIGDKCEENCCQDGWRIDVNPDGYYRLLAATQFAPVAIGRRIRAAIRELPAKDKKSPKRFIIKQDKSGACPLFDDGWCAIHSNFGLTMLPHVCAIYPRKLKRIGDRYELSATASCPEIARQLLLPDDGVDVVPLDLNSLNRVVLQGGLDPRDRRPFYRAVIRVRDTMMELFRDESLPLEQRYFLMTWFGKRTSDTLKKGLAHADMAPVEREFAMLKDPRVRAAIAKRYDALETPSGLCLLVVRAVVRPQASGVVRVRWNNLIDTVINSYMRLKEILPKSQDEAEHDRAAAEQTERVHLQGKELWDEYRRRRDRVRARAGDRVDHFFKTYTIHTWYHRLPTEEQSLFPYVLRMLAQQTAMKFLFVGHPALQTALDEADAMPKEEGDAYFREVLDKTCVDVFYQIARHVEHGALIKWLVDILKKSQLHSMAGAVHMIRF